MGFKFSPKKTIELLVKNSIKTLCIENGLDPTTAELVSASGSAIVGGFTFEKRKLSPTSKINTVTKKCIVQAFGNYGIKLKKYQINSICDICFSYINLFKAMNLDNPVEYLAEDIMSIVQLSHDIIIPILNTALEFISKEISEDTDLLILHIDSKLDSIMEHIIRTERAQTKEFIFTRNEYDDTLPSHVFIGRAEELDIIYEFIEQGTKAVLLSGMGGIGKTEIAKKIFRDLVKAFRDGIPMNVQRLGYMQYTTTMDNTLVDSFDFDKTNISRNDLTLQAWIKLKELMDQEKTLLFVDNVYKTTSQDKSLKKLNGLNGSIIITSRNVSFGNFVPLTIEKMNLDLCVGLFERLFWRKIKSEEYADLKYILAELAAKHTLTVKHFASISNCYSWSISELKNNLIDKGFSIKYIADGEETELVEEYKKLFILASLTEKEIYALEIFSLLPYYPIKQEVVIEWMNNLEEDKLILFTLYSKGWLERDQDSYLMHPVISEVIRASRELKASDYANLIKCCLDKLTGNIAQTFFHTLPYWDISHSIISSVKIPDTPILGELAIKAGNLFYDIEDYAKAKELYSFTIEHFENPSLRSKAHHDLAMLYKTTKNYKLAIKHYNIDAMTCVELYTKVSLEYANTCHNMGVLYKAMGKYKKAKKMYREELNIKTILLGNCTHLDYALIYNNLGTVHFVLKEYTDSLRYATKALQIKKEIIKNPDDPSFDSSNFNVGEVLCELGKYGEALGYLSESERICLVLYGDEHISTVETYIKLAEAYKGDNNPQFALKYSMKAYLVYHKREAIEAKVYERELYNYYLLAGLDPHRYVHWLSELKENHVWLI